MIFDDSFSAIDRINKKNILDNLMLLEDDSTKIIITHDIELSPKFEKIIYIDDGQAIDIKKAEYMENKIGEEYA